MKPEAQLVYDGHELHIPVQCGEPAPGQMVGTVAERLAELAGRECYDSLGNGRDSGSFHQHILEVGHFSIYEHHNFTLLFPGVAFEPEVLLDLANRPGVYLRVADNTRDLRVTLNLRCVLDWRKWRPPHREPSACPMSIALAAYRIAPAVIAKSGLLGEPHAPLDVSDIAAANPIDDEERWITLRLTGSRGFSHELVRHGDRTAISQRSTRYVDEAESDWCMHPLTLAMMDDPENHEFFGRVQDFISESRNVYREIVRRGSLRLMNTAGMTAVTARKQSRGAARGFLGNALGTSVIFSASVAQWRRMLVMRCHPAADAEIRESAAEVLRVLKASNYGDRFSDMLLVPSPDGLGEVLA